MSRGRRPIEEQVVVITGASQGIGRATALTFAARGARVVAAARNEEALGTLVDAIRQAGGVAEAALVDVADADQVEALGERAMAAFGRIDTWVNDAAVSTYGTVDQITAAEMERLVRVDLLGQMYGSKVALERMRPAGQGTIINVGSALSDRAIPLQAAYVASKHGVAGFTEALRLEVEGDAPGISVVLILPSSMDTPLFALARSRLGVRPRPVPPVYHPQAVADAIVHAAEHGGREIVVGGWGKLLLVGQWLSPSLVDRWMGFRDRLVRQQRTSRPDDPRDNLFEPSTGPGSITGGVDEPVHDTSWYTTVFELHPWRKRLATVGVGLGLVTLIRRLGR
jgi:short-subunit dehydrogenase